MVAVAGNHINLFITSEHPAINLTEIPYFKLSLCFALHIFLCDILTFIVKFFTFCKSDLHKEISK